MKSRVKARAGELLQQGHRLSKHTLAMIAPCHQRTAQRVLAEIRTEDNQRVRIVAWVREYHQHIPVYAVSARVKDEPKPAPVSDVESKRKRRENVEVQIDEIMRKQGARDRAKFQGRETDTSSEVTGCRENSDARPTLMQMF